MEELKVGDVVELKSGGPEMTVETIYDSGVDCIWMDDNTVRSANFKKQMLKY
jgi:uncharacterized protein YodC (DUF2158 family)